MEHEKRIISAKNSVMIITDYRSQIGLFIFIGTNAVNALSKYTLRVFSGMGVIPVPVVTMLKVEL